MKIDITYDANGLNITLDYDHDAQKSFARAGEAADWFRRREGDEPTGDKWNPTALDQLDQGIDLLRRLGGEGSRRLCFSPVEAWQALDAVLLTTVYCLTNGRSISDFESAVMFMAGMTPLPVSKLLLPPAAEVFDRGTTHESAWAAYEAIRCWPHRGKPHLFLVQLCQLRHELGRLSHLPGDLKTLIDELTAITMMFRYTLFRMNQDGNKSGPTTEKIK